jgi:hypothetical protein
VSNGPWRLAACGVLLEEIRSGQLTSWPLAAGAVISNCANYYTVIDDLMQQFLALQNAAKWLRGGCGFMQNFDNL